MGETVSIPGRFNCPLDSGNGGYSSGVAAGLLEGTVEANLRRPVPLDKPLDVAREDDGSVRILDGQELIIEARPASGPEVDVPAPVSLKEAHQARERYRGVSGEVFSRCFVCGRDRGDALEVFAGEVEGRELVASPWTPPAWTADEAGDVRPEFVWAVLDCPTFFAAYLGEELPASVLARLTARLDGPVRAGEEHVVMAWPIEADGRKRHAGAAVLSSEGETFAVARALMVELRQ